MNINDLMIQRANFLKLATQELDPLKKAELEKTAQVLKEEIAKQRDINIREYWENLPDLRGITDEAGLWQYVPDLPKPLTPWHFEKLEKAGAIPKRKLVDGATYFGKCRNATEAVWHADKNVFIYKRHKFGFVYDEDINHYEDDNGFDLFVPVKRMK